MKSLIFLLATAAALPHANPNADLRPDLVTAANPATTANMPDAATALVVFGSDTVRAEVANTAET